MKDLNSSDVIAICAVIVAVSALAVSIWQAWLMRQYQVLSVKPHLDVSLSASQTNGNAFVVYFPNAGVGPAFIESIEVRLGNVKQSIQTENDIRTLIGLLVNTNELKYSFQIVDENSAISSGDRIDFLSVSASNDPSILTQLRSTLRKAEIEVRYSCLYGHSYSSTFVGSKVMA
jgi:S-formylglutathione hydrolase FrmB